MQQRRTNPRSPQTGVALIVVLVILVVVSILGVSGVQISMLAERAARNDRDLQVAWQASEAAMLDAQFDIEGLTGHAQRSAIFKVGQTDVSQFAAGCSGPGHSQGLCAVSQTAKPAWLDVDFLASGEDAATVAFGSFTGRSFPAGEQGVQPARAPRYVIEAVPDPQTNQTTDPSERQYLYRVTAMGFGPRTETQAVLQMLYRH